MVCHLHSLPQSKWTKVYCPLHPFRSYSYLKWVASIPFMDSLPLGQDKIAGNPSGREIKKKLIHSTTAGSVSSSHKWNLERKKRSLFMRWSLNTGRLVHSMLNLNFIWCTNKYLNRQIYYNCDDITWNQALKTQGRNNHQLYATEWNINAWLKNLPLGPLAALAPGIGPSGLACFLKRHVREASFTLYLSARGIRGMVVIKSQLITNRSFYKTYTWLNSVINSWQWLYLDKLWGLGLGQHYR